MLKTTWRLCAIAALLVPLLSACNTEGDGKGDECQPCRDDAPRCDSGMSCTTFDDTFGKDHHLCAKPSTRTCSVP